jgi:hypothetical protein
VRRENAPSLLSYLIFYFTFINLPGNLNGEDHFGGTVIHGRILPERTFNAILSCGLDSVGSRSGTLAFPCEHGTEPLGYLLFWKFLDELNEYECSKEGIRPWSNSVCFSVQECLTRK